MDKLFFLPSKNTQKSTDFNSVANVIQTPKDFVIKKSFYISDYETSILLGQKVGFRGFSSDYTALATDYVIGIATTTAAYTLSLPPASTAGVGKVYIIKDIGGSATSNNITIDGYGSELINGQTTFPINTNYDSVGLICNGENWFTI